MKRCALRLGRCRRDADSTLARLQEVCEAERQRLRARWLDTFTMVLGALSTTSEPAVISALAAELVDEKLHVDPEYFAMMLRSGESSNGVIGRST